MLRPLEGLCPYVASTAATSEKQERAASRHYFSDKLSQKMVGITWWSSLPCTSLSLKFPTRLWPCPAGQPAVSPALALASCPLYTKQSLLQKMRVLWPFGTIPCLAFAWEKELSLSLTMDSDHKPAPFRETASHRMTFTHRRLHCIMSPVICIFLLSLIFNGLDLFKCFIEDPSSWLYLRLFSWLDQGFGFSGRMPHRWSAFALQPISEDFAYWKWITKSSPHSKRGKWSYSSWNRDNLHI